MWPFSRKKVTPKFAKNPHLGQRAGFFSTDADRLLTGWDTHSKSIDYYLQQELTKIRARSRESVRGKSYGKRFIGLMKSNIVGPDGVKISSQRALYNGKLDKRSNDAVERAFKDWAQYHCDFTGKASFTDLQNMAIACAAQDGEFIFEIKYSGDYGFQLKAIDPELLDTDKHEYTRNGEIRLGIEYDAEGKVIYYHFKKRSHEGSYYTAETYKIAAKFIIHGFLPEFPDQSRGIPWNRASLEDLKHLGKYQEGAIVNARASANTFVGLTSEGDDNFEGGEQVDDENFQEIENGSIVNFGNRTPVNIDPTYPHQMYSDFVKANLRSIASGLDVSYHTLSNDLEGVNYSSIRAGVLEDRELFKSLQNWLIRCFVRPVFEAWVGHAYLSGKIVLSGGKPVVGNLQSYKKAHYQPRRWAWVDPLKDMTANKMYIDERLKSRSQIMREQGDEPDEVWAEIAKEEEIMKSLGIQPIQKNGGANNAATNDDKEDDDPDEGGEEEHSKGAA